MARKVKRKTNKRKARPSPRVVWGSALAMARSAVSNSCNLTKAANTLVSSSFGAQVQNVPAMTANTTITSNGTYEIKAVVDVTGNSVAMFSINDSDIVLWPTPYVPELHRRGRPKCAYCRRRKAFIRCGRCGQVACDRHITMLYRKIGDYGIRLCDGCVKQLKRTR